MTVVVRCSDLIGQMNCRCESFGDCTVLYCTVRRYNIFNSPAGCCSSRWCHHHRMKSWTIIGGRKPSNTPKKDFLRPTTAPIDPFLTIAAANFISDFIRPPPDNQSTQTWDVPTPKRTPTPSEASMIPVTQHLILRKRGRSRLAKDPPRSSRDLCIHCLQSTKTRAVSKKKHPLLLMALWLNQQLQHRKSQRPFLLHFWKI